MKFVPVPRTKVLFSIYETRRRDFAIFVTENGYDMGRGEKMQSLETEGPKPREQRDWRNPGFTQNDNHPVIGVSWEDVRAFCEWLTTRERAAGRITENQLYRAPTDLEWSAAVGLPEESGSTPQRRSTKVENVYPWGTEWPPPRGAGNFAGEESKTRSKLTGYRDSYTQTAPVGSFAPNNLGLYDLAGNAWEWCEDESAPDQRKDRVLRGGSWGDADLASLLSSYRNLDRPGRRNDTYGFRVVLGNASTR